ncbi:AAA family ATPase [Micromonospora sp. STR1s_5]|nr:AAA family ATPase [Micromonospora sp. STR1s_5]
MSAALNLDHELDQRFGAGAVPAPARIRPAPYVYRPPGSIPPRECLYGGHYFKQFVSVTAAPGGMGKTGLALVEHTAMSTGRDLLGSKPRQRVRTWYINLEDPLEELERRVGAILLHYQIPPDEVSGHLFLNSGRDTRLVIAETSRDKVTIARPVVDDLIRGIRENGIDVLTVDPFVSSHQVSENDNGAIDMVVKTWASIAEACNCSIELIHHVRKGNGAAEYTVDDARGAGSLIGAARSARVLNVMSADEAAKADVPLEDRRRYFRVGNGKANMAPPMDRAVWRKLVSVDLGNGTNDYPSDSVGVVTHWEMPGLFDDLTVADLRKVQVRIAKGSWAENRQADNWAGYAVAEALDIPADTEAEKQRIRALLKVWISNKALKVERQHDSRAGRDKPMIVVGDTA